MQPSLSFLALLLAISAQLYSVKAACPNQDPCGTALFGLVKQYTMCNRQGEDVCVGLSRLKKIRGFECGSCALGGGDVTSRIDYDFVYLWPSDGDDTPFSESDRQTLEQVTNTWLDQHAFSSASFSGTYSGQITVLTQAEPDRLDFDEFYVTFDTTVAVDGGEAPSSSAIRALIQTAVDDHFDDYKSALQNAFTTFFDGLSDLEPAF